MIKFGYTIFYVESVENTLEFYKNSFGINIKFLHESKDYGELNTGETTLAFASLEMAKLNFVIDKIETNSIKKQFTTEIALVTDNVESTLEKALLNKATLVKEPEKKSWGQTVAYIRDIDNNLIELCTPISSD